MFWFLSVIFYPYICLKKQLALDMLYLRYPFRYRSIGIENQREEEKMLKWAIVFAIISIIAGIFGFTGIAAGAAGIAKVLFFLFVAAFVLILVLALFAGKAVT